MSIHELTIRVDVDEAFLAEQVARRERSRSGLLIGTDPSEWDIPELIEVLSQEIATGEVVGYEAIIDGSSAYAVDKAARS